MNEDGPISSSWATPVTVALGRCPAAPRLNRYGVALNLTYAYPGVYYAYDGTRFFAWGYQATNPLSAAQVRKPSAKAVLVEFWPSYAPAVGAGSLSWGRSPLNDQSIVAVHRGRSNLLLADGHVQPVAVAGGDAYGLVQWIWDPLWQAGADTMTQRLP